MHCLQLVINFILIRKKDFQIIFPDNAMFLLWPDVFLKLKKSQIRIFSNSARNQCML